MHANPWSRTQTRANVRFHPGPPGWMAASASPTCEWECGWQGFARACVRTRRRRYVSSPSLFSVGIPVMEHVVQDAVGRQCETSSSQSAADVEFGHALESAQRFETNSPARVWGPRRVAVRPAAFNHVRAGTPFLPPASKWTLAMPLLSVSLPSRSGVGTRCRLCG